MLSQALYLGIFLFALNYFLDYRDWLGWSRNTVFKNKPGVCKALDADGDICEDVTHVGNGLMIFSSLGTLNFGGEPGSMRIRDIYSSDNKASRMRIIDAPHRSDFLSSPHGISAWKDPETGKIFIYVLTHPPKEDRVEVFEFSAPSSLKYIKTITDSSFAYMNDLVVVGKDQFYITKYWHFRDMFKIVAENMLRVPIGKIYFYNGHKAREVASGLINPNGINVSPDGKYVYMAEWSRKKLHGFRRESSNNLVKVWEYDTGTGIDNIEVDPDTGDLWIGCHPLTWRIIDFYNIFQLTGPSQVIRVKIRDYAVSEVEEIFADDGTFIGKSTAAAYFNGTILVGSIGDSPVQCHVNYLSD